MAHGPDKVTKHPLAGTRKAERQDDDSISTPVLIFTDADSRDDLYSLSKASNAVEAWRPGTAGSNAGTKTNRKKPHLADLVLESPPITSAPNSSGTERRPNLSGNMYSSTGIGLALGSPSQSPWVYNKAAGSATSFDTRGPSPLSTPLPDPAAVIDDGLKDKGKWKMFGGIFAKKPQSNPVSPAAPFYKAQHPVSTNYVQPQPNPGFTAPSRHRRVTSRSLDHIPNSTNAKPRSTTWTPIQLPRRPSMKKAPSAPVVEKVRSPTPPPKDYPVKLATVATIPCGLRPMVKPTASAPVVRDDKPAPKLKLLEIDIPNVAMERYSIMFGDVLKPRQSLLERRQGQLPQLRMVDSPKEDNTQRIENHVPVRRATVPSPTFSLFPLPPSRNGPHPSNPHNLPPLPRSMTAPAASPAASPPTIARSPFPQRHESRIHRIAHSPSQSSDTPVSLHDQWHSDSSPVSTVASEEEGLTDSLGDEPSIMVSGSDHRPVFEDLRQIITSGGAEVEHELEELRPAPLKTYLPTRPNEKKTVSEFQVLQSQASTLLPESIPAPVTHRKESLPNQSSSHTVDKFRQILQPNPLKSSPASATEISVARKLSLSRRQQMLVPVVPKAVQPPQQPKLINPDDLPEPPPLGRKTSASRPREKSQYIVLDSV